MRQWAHSHTHKHTQTHGSSYLYHRICSYQQLWSNYQTPPNPLNGLTWNFVGWYIEVLGRFSNRSHWFKLPISPDFLLPTFAVSVFVQTPSNPLDRLTWNFVGLYIGILGMFSNRSHWFKLPIPPDLLLPIFAVSVFYQTPPNPLDGLTWNFVGWYIDILRRFFYRFQWFKLPLPPDLLLPTFAVRVFLPNSSKPTGRIDMKFCRVVHRSWEGFPTSLIGSSYLYHRICSYRHLRSVCFTKLLLTHWTDWHETL